MNRGSWKARVYSFQLILLKKGEEKPNLQQDRKGSWGNSSVPLSTSRTYLGDPNEVEELRTKGRASSFVPRVCVPRQEPCNSSQTWAEDVGTNLHKTEISSRLDERRKEKVNSYAKRQMASTWWMLLSVGCMSWEFLWERAHGEDLCFSLSRSPREHFHFWVPNV